MFNNDLILAIEAKKANSQNVEEYLISLENFLSDGRNIIKPEYYKAKQHKQLCEDFLDKQVDEPIGEPSASEPSSRYLGRNLRLPMEEIERRLLTYAEDGYTDAQLEGLLIALSKEANCTSFELKNLYNAIKLQEEREEFISTTKQEVDEIIRLKGRTIDIREFVPSVLADEIIKFSDCLKVRPESCLTALLPALTT